MAKDSTSNQNTADSTDGTAGDQGTAPAAQPPVSTPTPAPAPVPAAAPKIDVNHYQGIGGAYYVGEDGVPVKVS